MTMIEVKMQTGWIPVISDDIKNTTDLQNYIVDGDIVSFYFENLDTEQKCFNLDVEQKIKERNPKPAYVKIYDSETDSSVTREYDIKTTCGTKEELPFLTPEEYDRLPPIIQARVPIGHPDLAPIPEKTEKRENVPTSLRRLKDSSGKQIFTVSCPVCKESMDVTSREFTDLVCNSARIFKVKIARKDSVKCSMKIYADMKRRNKLSFHKFVNYQMQKVCYCGILEQKGEKLMFFDTMNQYSEFKKELKLSKSTTIVQWTKRQVFKKNNKCL